MRVKKVDPSGTTIYVGAVEVLITGTTQLTTSYYAFGGAMVVMRTAATATLTYLHGDHLGSTSLTTNASGQKVSEQRYKPYGEVRWSSGAGMPTDKQFTSQTRLTEGYVGTLYDYVARAYDPVLGRFISADTIVPGAGNPAAFNRYMYVLGNPLGLVDPSGHDPYLPLDVIRARLYGMQYRLNNDPEYGELGVKADTYRLYVHYQGAAGALGLSEFKEDAGFFAAASAEKASQVIMYPGCKVCLPENELSAGFAERVTMADAANIAGYNPGQMMFLATGSRKQDSIDCSFSPETPIATDNGQAWISAVVTGTRVLAWDETANATGYFPVTHVWVHSDPVLVVLVVNGETITTTPEHPFYTPMHGWLPAGELWAGAGLRRADGGAGVVESTMTLTRTERMWNLTVDVAHTYFVGGGEWLVHNAGCVRPGQPGKPDHQATVAKLRSMATDEWRADPMVEIVENVSIRGATGVNRIPDVSAWRGKDVVKVYEAARVNKYGGLVQREQLKMLEYFDNDVRYFFLEVK